jgi:HAD superfamily hydrolase (TIGR01509 family)
VLFDLGDTLTDNRPCPPAQMDRLIAKGFAVWLRRRSMRAGDEFTPDDRAKLASIGGARLVEAVNKGLEDVRDRYWQHGLEAPLGTAFIRLQAEIAAASGLVASLSELEEVYLKERHSRQRPLAGAVELLSQLRSRGLKLGVVSNSVFSREPMYAHLRQTGLAGYMDTVVFSSDVGARKPQAKPFLAALSQMGCVAGDAVFVGDSPEADLAGAAGAGMAAIWLWGHNEAVGGLPAEAGGGGGAGSEPEQKLGPGVWPDLSSKPELRTLIAGLVQDGAGAAGAGLVGAARNHAELAALLLER